MSERIFVGISEMKIAKSPNVLETQGLGSCVAIVIYDENQKIAGMSHSMLPSIKDASQKKDLVRAKYVDSAIDDLVEELTKNGAKKNMLKSKIAGGANMFPAIILSNDTIGKRNLNMAETKLKEKDIKIVSKDVGGNVGRTVVFDIDKLKFYIKTATNEIREI